MPTADRFRAFAATAAADGSPLSAGWAAGVADDADVVRLVDRAQEARRQPVLFFAVCRWLGAPLEPFVVWRAWVLAHADEVVAELDRRLTQTNDVRRCLPLSIALARVEGPVALLEVGASAGLCLFPDRFAYDARDADLQAVAEAGAGAGGTVEGADAAWGDRHATVRLAATVSGGFVPPSELPSIVWRAGLDLDPVDVRDPEAVAWLETLLPPERSDRLALLRRAVDVARTAPPRLEAGDAVDALARLAADAPAGATLVVVSMGTLVYLPGARRQAFVDEVRRLGARWISYERTGSLLDVRVPDGSGVGPAAVGGDGFATLALDGEPLAVGDAHGTRLRMLATCPPPAGA